MPDGQGRALARTDQQIFLASDSGKAIRFSATDARETKSRTGIGVRGMSLTLKVPQAWALAQAALGSGVAKAGADVINVAGNTGGTGAASVTSLKYTGRVAEIGIRRPVP